jgi:hypothetical protein
LPTAGTILPATMALPTCGDVRYHQGLDLPIVVREPDPTCPRLHKLLHRVPETNPLRHGSRNTEKSYVPRRQGLNCPGFVDTPDCTKVRSE